MIAHFYSKTMTSTGLASGRLTRLKPREVRASEVHREWQQTSCARRLGITARTRQPALHKAKSGSHRVGRLNIFVFCRVMDEHIVIETPVRFGSRGHRLGHMCSHACILSDVAGPRCLIVLDAKSRSSRFGVLDGMNSADLYHDSLR